MIVLNSFPSSYLMKTPRHSATQPTDKKDGG